MSVAPCPSAFETRCNAAYEALMWALSRPGLPRVLPEAGHASIVDALLDRECAVFCAMPALSQHVARTGAALVDLASADHVFVDHMTSADMLRDLAQGSDLHPEAGATLIVNAVLGTGQRLRLTGPGIETAIELQVGGLPDGFWQMRAQVMRYPTGFEVFLTDGADVLGVPRSTKVEVL